MSRRVLFTTITPLPAGVTRQTVLDFLHNHEEMIDLNPLVKERHPIPTPSHAPSDEQHCQWYSLTDKISYLPGVTGDVTYTCAFNDIPTGIQTHCYAPAGLSIRDKWTVGGSLPGEAPQAVELGLSVPPVGLYLREDVDMRCNVIMAGFVKKTLKKSHAALVDRLKLKAEIAGSNSNNSKAKRKSDSSSASSEPDHSTATTKWVQDTITNLPYHQLPDSAPRARSSSLASSAVSAASSGSVYSVQSSSRWFSTQSSRRTSPAVSATSLPTTYTGVYRPKVEGQPAAVHATQTKQSTPTPQPKAVPQPAREMKSTTADVIIEPETPFLRTQQPDWPLRTLAVPQSQDQQKQPTKLSKQQRPQTQLFTKPYRPDNRISEALNSGITLRVHPQHARALSDDALWQALGGGRTVTLARGGNELNSNTGSQNTPAGKDATRTRALSYDRSHPEYPQLNPYSEQEEESDPWATSVRMELEAARARERLAVNRAVVA